LPNGKAKDRYGRARACVSLINLEKRMGDADGHGVGYGRARKAASYNFSAACQTRNNLQL
jgi:hypothetical protein